MHQNKEAFKTSDSVCCEPMIPEWKCDQVLITSLERDYSSMTKGCNNTNDNCTAMGQSYERKVTASDDIYSLPLDLPISNDNYSLPLDLPINNDNCSLPLDLPISNDNCFLPFDLPISNEIRPTFPGLKPNPNEEELREWFWTMHRQLSK